MAFANILSDAVSEPRSSTTPTSSSVIRSTPTRDPTKPSKPVGRRPDLAYDEPATLASLASTASRHQARPSPAPPSKVSADSSTKPRPTPLPARTSSSSQPAPSRSNRNRKRRSEVPVVTEPAAPAEDSDLTDMDEVESGINGPKRPAYTDPREQLKRKVP